MLKLNDKDRAILYLRAGEDLAYETIAQIVGRSPETCRKRYERAKERFEAAALLGREFRLPDIAGYVVNLYEMQYKSYLEKDHSFYSVTVVMHNIESSPIDSNHLLTIRVTRDDTSFVSDNPFEIQVTGPIEELYINCVKVYAISDNGQMIRYIWEYDGITYEIFARDGISHAEYLRIIASMIQ